MNDVAHLAVFHPLSAPDFHHDVLPGGLFLRLGQILLLLLLTGLASLGILEVGSEGSFPSQTAASRVLRVRFPVDLAATDLFVDDRRLHRRLLGSFWRLSHALLGRCLV